MCCYPLILSLAYITFVFLRIIRSVLLFRIRNCKCSSMAISPLRILIILAFWSLGSSFYNSTENQNNDLSTKPKLLLSFFFFFKQRKMTRNWWFFLFLRAYQFYWLSSRGAARLVISLHRITVKTQNNPFIIGNNLTKMSIWIFEYFPAMLRNIGVLFTFLAYRSHEEIRFHKT